MLLLAQHAAAPIFAQEEIGLARSSVLLPTRPAQQAAMRRSWEGHSDLLVAGGVETVQRNSLLLFANVRYLRLSQVCHLGQPAP